MNRIMLVVERLAPRLVLPSFNHQFKRTIDKYLVDSVVDTDSSGEPIYGKRLPRDSIECINDLLQLIKSHIDDIGLQNDLFDVSISQEEPKAMQAIELALSLNGGGYLDTQDVFLRFLELTADNTRKWVGVFDQIVVLDYLLSNYDNKDNRYEKFIKESEEIILNIRKAEEDVQEWLH